VARLLYHTGLTQPDSRYSGHGLESVSPGTVVEVPDDDALRILADHPHAFAYADREMRAAPALASASVDVAAILDAPLRDLAEALETGAYDDLLDELQAAESAGKDRHGAHRLIAQRRG